MKVFSHTLTLASCAFLLASAPQAMASDAPGGDAIKLYCGETDEENVKATKEFKAKGEGEGFSKSEAYKKAEANCLTDLTEAMTNAAAAGKGLPVIACAETSICKLQQKTCFPNSDWTTGFDDDGDIKLNPTKATKGTYTTRRMPSRIRVNGQDYNILKTVYKIAISCTIKAGSWADVDVSCSECDISRQSQAFNAFIDNSIGHDALAALELSNLDDLSREELLAVAQFQNAVRQAVSASDKHNGCVSFAEIEDVLSEEELEEHRPALNYLQGFSAAAQSLSLGEGNPVSPQPLNQQIRTNH